MRLPFVIATILFCRFAGAAPIIVESVKGHYGTVYIPPNVFLHPGDELISASEAPAPAKMSAPNRPAAPRQTDHSRRHNLSFQVTQNKVKNDYKDSLDDVTVTTSNVNFSYGYDFGFIQPLGLLSVQSQKVDGGESASLRTLAVGVRVNAIKNISGHDLIPFAALAFGFAHGDDKSSTVDISINSHSMTFASVGLDWYPFGQIFAVEVGYTSLSGSVDVTGNPSSTSLSSSDNSFSVGWVISF